MIKRDLKERIKVFIKRPFRYQIRSIKSKVKSNLYKILLGLVRPVSRVINSSPFIRNLVFDLKDDQYAISSGECIFVVNTADVTIGRSVYSKKIPFDIEKLETVVELIGRSKSTIVDIGANIGTICIGGIRKGFFKSGYAIEPEPRNYSLLSANVALNQLTEFIVAKNIALGEHNDATLEFELCNDNHGDHRVRANEIEPLFNEQNRTTILVQSQTFDRALSNVNFNEALIWIDVQGYEGYVLSKASSALQNTPPICLEFWPYGLERSGSYPLLKKALISHGYQYFYDLNTPEIRNVLNEAALDGLRDKIGITGVYTDILCL